MGKSTGATAASAKAGKKTKEEMNKASSISSTSQEDSPGCWKTHVSCLLLKGGSGDAPKCDMGAPGHLHPGEF